MPGPETRTLIAAEIERGAELARLQQEAKRQADWRKLIWEKGRQHQAAPAPVEEPGFFGRVFGSD
jgi:hypothetical protein